MNYSHTSRRLPTDAKIILERAGYTVTYNSFGDLVVSGLRLAVNILLAKVGGCVDNDEVVAMLAAAGFNEFGHKVGANDKA